MANLNAGHERDWILLVFQFVPLAPMDQAAVNRATALTEARVDSMVLASVNQDGQDLPAILEVFA